MRVILRGWSGIGGQQFVLGLSTRIRCSITGVFKEAGEERCLRTCWADYWPPWVIINCIRNHNPGKLFAVVCSTQNFGIPDSQARIKLKGYLLPLL